MAELLSTDEFLVNRNDVTYTQEQETLMATLQDTDHLLINRAGQTYKITGEDLINSVIDPLEVTVILAPTDGYTDTEVTAVPVVSGGKQPDGGFIFTYQWVTADDDAGTNKANIAGETNATFTPDSAQVGQYLGCVVGTTDALGTSAESEAYIGPIQVLAQAPVIADIAISEIYDGQNRFTDKEFPYVTTMAVDGEPDPTYEVKAKLSGTTFDFDVLSDVITDVEGGGIKTCETDTIQSVATSTYSVRYQTSNTNGSNLDWNSGTNEETNINSGSSPTKVQTNSLLFYSEATGAKYGVATDVCALTNGDLEAWESSTGAAGAWTKVASGNLSQFGSQCSSYIVPRSSEKYFALIRKDSQLDSDNYYVTEETITLTFPTSNGFGCFEVGDEVQSDAIVGDFISKLSVNTGTLSDASKNNAFDGDTSTECLGSSSASMITFDLSANPISYKSKVEIYTESPYDEGRINDSAFVDMTQSAWTTLATGSGVIYKIEVKDDSAKPAWTAIKVDGKYLIDSSLYTGDEVKVISKDDSDPYTITVDGGEWSDGGSDPTKNESDIWSQTLYGDLSVIKPTLPATNMFDGSASTHMTLTHKNGSVFFPLDTPQSGTFSFNGGQGTDKIQPGYRAGIRLRDADNNVVVETDWDTDYGNANNSLKVDVDLVAATNVSVIEFYYGNAVIDDGGFRNSFIKINGIEYVDASGQTKLVKETPYDNKLTVASSENLELLTGDVFMTDGSEVPATQTPYKLVTTDIESVSVEDHEEIRWAKAKWRCKRLISHDNWLVSVNVDAYNAVTRWNWLRFSMLDTLVPKSIHLQGITLLKCYDS